MLTEKKERTIGKKVFRVLAWISIIIAVVLSASYLYADNMPVIFTGYEKKIQTGGTLEEKYMQMGELSTKKYTAQAENPINKYTAYYPEELETVPQKYPMILIVNGTGFKATKYEPEFKLYASWGFITVGNQDKGTGTGETTIEMLNYMLAENEDPESVFYQKIDVDNIGITGFSQGGAAVFNAITKFEKSKYFKAAFALSPASEAGAEFTGYPYNSALVECPIAMFAGTDGQFETEVVLPIEKMRTQYEKISAPKVMARRIGMDHDHMMYSAGGYVMAWFRWQLMGDEEAAGVYTGENPELLSNSLYQDQNIQLGE